MNKNEIKILLQKGSTSDNSLEKNQSAVNHFKKLTCIKALNIFVMTHFGTKDLNRRTL